MNEETCIGCGATDDHPKHIVVVNGEHDHVAWHKDCHRLSGAGCAVCARLTEGAEHLRGEELREHIVRTSVAAVVDGDHTHPAFDEELHALLAGATVEGGSDAIES